MDGKDYWQALGRLNRQASWRIVGISFGLWFAAAFVGSFYFIQHALAWGPLEIATVAIFALLGVSLLAAMAMRVISRFRLNRAVTRSESGPLAAVTLQISDEGITWEDGNTKTWYAWGSFERIEVTDRLVLLYSSPVEAIMIPRRVLGNDESMTNFVSSAREHILQAQRQF